MRCIDTVRGRRVERGGDDGDDDDTSPTPPIVGALCSPG